MKKRSTQPSRAPGRPGVARDPLRPDAAPAAPSASPLAGPHADPKAAHDAAGVESVAGEEDPGSALDPPAPPGAS